MNESNSKTKILKTQKCLGIKGDNSILVAIQISKIEKDFNEPFDEILLAVRTLFRNYIGDDYLEVTKVIRDGFEADANSKGEFLDNIREFSDVLKKQNYNLPSIIKITSLMAKDVEFSDRLIDIRHYS